MTEQLDGQMTFLDLASPSGRTSPEHSAVTKGRTSKPSSKRSATSKNQGFLFLNLRKENGNQMGVLWETTGVLLGLFLTHVKWGESASRRGENESTLSQILDLNAPDKYYLSQKACAGILRRAEQRKKMLPDMLKEALMEVVGSGGCD